MSIINVLLIALAVILIITSYFWVLFYLQRIRGKTFFALEDYLDYRIKSKAKLLIVFQHNQSVKGCVYLIRPLEKRIDDHFNFYNMKVESGLMVIYDDMDRVITAFDLRESNIFKASGYERDIVEYNNKLKP